MMCIRVGYKHDLTKIRVLFFACNAAAAGLVTARVAAIDIGRAAPVADSNPPTRAPIAALAFAQLPQCLEPAA